MVESNNNQVEIKSIAQSVDDIQDAVLKLQIHDNQEQGNMAQLPPFPDRPGEPDCAYYLRTGSCGYGTNCRYNHPPVTAQVTQRTEELPERVGQPDCGYYIRTGTCKYGSICKYNHPRDRNGAGPVSFNTLGLPIRQDEKPCPHYLRTGNCKFNVACKFHHPELLTYDAGSAQSGPAAFGSTMSSVVPSMGLTYVSGIPSFPRTPYMSNPYLQGLQTYMPVIFSPSQVLNPTQGWNTYMGSNLLYNTRNQGELGYDGQSHLSNYSERTNQQKMNSETGTKKYGSDGKYHHTKERIALPVADIGPHGLPLRPGLAVCSYYSSYGLCKFGPGCRFDHPFNGYPYNYGMSISHLPMVDASSLNSKQHKSDTNTKTSTADPPEQPGSSQPKSSQTPS